MGFRVLPLPASRFTEHFGASDEELAERGIRVYVADKKPGYPCRVELRDAKPGQRLLLLNYEHQPAANPYRASHAVFVLDGARQADLPPNQVPSLLSRRTLSVRAFDGEDMMVDAAVVPGEQAAERFASLLQRHDVNYVHVHTAARGCYLAQVVRS